MEIVIDIPKEMYSDIKDNSRFMLDYCDIVAEAIANGTPLPKGHGRLIDADMLLSEIGELKQSPWYHADINGSYLVRKDAVEMIEDLCVRNAPTIIEKDKGE